MDEHRVCAALAERLVGEIRRICSMSTPEPALLERAARLADLAHNIPLWLVGQPAGRPLYDLLEDYARYTGCEETVAAEFDSVGEAVRAGRLRSGTPRPEPL